MRIAGELGYEVLERDVTRTDLYFADEVFLTGTAAEVTPVASVDDHQIGPGPVTRAIQSFFFDVVHGRSPLSAEYLEFPAGDRARPRDGRPVTIPLARPDLGPREEELVLEVLRSGVLSLGPMGRRFEEAFAAFVGTRHAVGVSSGTRACTSACAWRASAPATRSSPSRRSSRVGDSRARRAPSPSSSTSTRTPSTSIRRGRGGHHAPDARHHARPQQRADVRHGADPGHRPPPRPQGDRGLLPEHRHVLPGRPAPAGTSARSASSATSR